MPKPEKKGVRCLKKWHFKNWIFHLTFKGDLTLARFFLAKITNSEKANQSGICPSSYGNISKAQICYCPVLFAQSFLTKNLVAQKNFIFRKSVGRRGC